VKLTLTTNHLLYIGKPVTKRAKKNDNNTPIDLDPPEPDLPKQKRTRRSYKTKTKGIILFYYLLLF
jgi:hypothetical protein